MAAKMNYVPNASALALRGDSTHTLGVIVGDFSSPFLGDVLNALQVLAYEKGYTLVFTGHQSLEGETSVSSLLMKHRLDGILFVGSGIIASLPDDIGGHDIPFAHIGSGPLPKGVAQVSVDDRAGLSMALDHLRGLGHETIAFLGEGREVYELRRRIFHELASDLRVHDAYLADRSVATVRKTISDMLKKEAPLPTAIMACDDVTALSAQRAMYELGIQVPAQISVVGFDDIVFARESIPSLTTIRQPFVQMANEAFEWLTVNAEKSKGSDVPYMAVQPELIVRESCALAP